VRALAARGAPGDEFAFAPGEVSSMTGAAADPRPSISGDDVARAIEQGLLRLAERQDTSGRFPDVANAGPAYTAYPLLALVYAGLPLPPGETAAVVRWLRAEQRADGSFAPYPFAGRGDLCATAAVWAALRTVGVPAEDPAVAAAWAFVAARGGLDAVVHELYAHTNFAAVFIAMAGLVSPESVPLPPPGFVLLPPVRALLEARFEFVTVVAGMVAAGAVLEERRRAYATFRAQVHEADGSLAGRAEGALDRAAAAATDASLAVERAPVLRFLGELQNPNGSLDDTSLQTALLLGAYRALGLTAADPALARAAAWLRGMLVPARAGSLFNCFCGDVWDTALGVSALIRAGAPRSGPAVVAAVGWLLDAQIAATPGGGPAGAGGGWAFEGSNVKTPDCDDTGLALFALGVAAARHGDDALPADLGARVSTAMNRAGAWLGGMQNADGGWSAFQTWPASKPRGPILTEELGLIGRDLAETLHNLVDPPVALGSPSWEDVTARVLVGLGHCGYTTGAPMVARALGFLRSQQCESGAWWGRWMVNYLPTTAWALLGLAAVQADLGEPWVARAAAWVLSRQNPDGGWGEVEATYARPELAGRGPSMAPLTGLVLQALLAAGHGDGAAVARGVAYLLRAQRGDGTWPDDGWLHAFFPPQSFYHYALMPRLYPLAALGAYQALRTGQGRDESSALTTPAEVRAGAGRGPDGRWSDAFLDARRAEGDPLAAEVVQELLATGGAGAVNGMLAALVHSDEPLPAGLPAAAVAYFDRTGRLPSFADPARLALAERLFARAGWSVAAGLFCSALPQAYCAARGARVLVSTGRLQTDARRRILETAQFLFDVAADGGLSASGRGLRAAQKVRLVHAAVRHFAERQSSWDPADGVPLNQEDLAGTMLTFSCVILDALDRLGVAVSPAEREAWLHLWEVVGVMLGLREDLLPRDVADGAALMNAIRRRQWAPSPHGQALAAALTASMNEYLRLGALRDLPAVLIRHLAGDHCGDLLGLPAPDWTAALVNAGAEVLAVAEAPDRDAGMAALTALFNGKLAEALVTLQRLDKGAPFRIPASLRGDGAA
jgi:squalene/oxidosqualene cyclase-like protein